MQIHGIPQKRWASIPSTCLGPACKESSDIFSSLYFSCKSVFFGFCIVLFRVRQQYMSPRKTSLRLWLVSPNAAVLVSSVGSVHAGSTFPAIQGASLTSLSSQPNSLVTGGFPAEDEQHSQPVSPQGLHYLHSAYQVGKDSQVGFCAPLEKNSGQGRATVFYCLATCYCSCWGGWYSSYMGKAN